jgi:predicted Mrr-cat superfamily restriction endonuclease
MIPPPLAVSVIDSANHLGFNNTRIRALVKAGQPARSTQKI